MSLYQDVVYVLILLRLMTALLLAATLSVVLTIVWDTP